MEKRQRNINLGFRTTAGARDNLNFIQNHLSSVEGTKISKTQTLEIVLQKVADKIRKQEEDK